MRLRSLVVLSLVVGVGVAGQVTLAQANVVFSVSGEVTEASVDSDWLEGAFSGSVKAVHLCPDVHYDIFDPDLEPVPPGSPEYCGWTPFASIGPGVDAGDCSDPSRNDPANPGPGVTVIWIGSDHRSSGVDGFEIDEASLQGATQPLLCVMALADWYVPEFCLKSKTTGVVSCLQEEELHRLVKPIASALITVEPEESSEPEAPGGPADSPAPAELSVLPALPPEAKTRAKGEGRKKTKRKRRLVIGPNGTRLHGNAVVSKR